MSLIFKPQYLLSLREQVFRKFIIGAALKDFQAIETYAYLFTLAGADVLDISAFPLSVIAAQDGIKKALVGTGEGQVVGTGLDLSSTNNSLNDADGTLQLGSPLIMISVNIGEDPHFRRVELDSKLCTECLACVPTCPSNAFEELPSFKYNIDLCYGCSNCLEHCPHEALAFNTWSAFDPNSLLELNKLGAEAIEIHLNNDLDAFEKFYDGMPKVFKLESFCIGSGQMNNEQIIEATIRITQAVKAAHGEEYPFIIQSDGLPLSGALKNTEEADLASIYNAKNIFNTITRYNLGKNIFVQLAGGIDEHSLEKAHKMGVPAHGVALGSYARKKLSPYLDDLETAKKIVVDSFKLK